MNPQTSTLWYIPHNTKHIFSTQQDHDVLTAAEKYMEQHGTQAFERLMNKVYKL